MTGLCTCVIRTVTTKVIIFVPWYNYYITTLLQLFQCMSKIGKKKRIAGQKNRWKKKSKIGSGLGINSI